MAMNGGSKLSCLLTGLSLGALGGLLAAILLRNETREVLRERGGQGLDYLNRQAGKLREVADVIMAQGKKLMACKRCDALDQTTTAEHQAYQEDKRENLGG